MKIDKERTIENGKYIGIILIFAIFYLIPLLKSGYFGDDAANSLTDAYLKMDNIRLWDYIKEITQGWMRAQGRFFPLGFMVGYTLFTIFNSLIAYKLLTLFFILLNIIIFGVFIDQITDSRKTAFLSMLLAPLLFQFRIYHEPILSYGPLMQLIFLYTFLSLIFFQKYLKEGKPYAIVLSTIFYLLGLFTYEITYLFFLFHLFFAYAQEKKLKSTIKKTIPILLAVGVAISISIFLRSAIETFNVGYTIGKDVKVVGITFLKQFVGAFPLIYYALNPNQILCRNFTCIFSQIIFIDVVLTIIFSITAYWLFRNIKKNIHGHLLIGFALLLMMLPGALTSLAVKHQNELFWSAAYLPVYIQYFGVVLLIFTISHFIYHKCQKIYFKKIIAISLILSMDIILLLNLQNNRIVVENFNGGWHYPRKLLQEALENDLLKDIPEGSIILKDTNTPYDYDNQYFFFKHSGKKYQVKQIKSFLEEDDDKPDGYYIQKIDEEKIYMVKYQAFGKNDGLVFLGKVDDLIYNKKSNETRLINLNIEQVRIYYAFDKKTNNTLISKRKKINISEQTNYETVAKSLDEMTVMNKGEKFVLLEAPSDDIYDINAMGLTWMDTKAYQTLVFSYEETRKGEPLLETSPTTVIHSRLTEDQLIENLVDNTIIGENTGKAAEGLTGMASYFNGTLASSATLPPIDIGQDFTVEMILYPYKNNVLYNVLIGNHPGNAFGGFVIQQDGSEQFNHYAVGFGDGTHWVNCEQTPNFQLDPYQWYYLAVNFEKNAITIFINGKKELQTSCDGLGMEKSDLPLIIGNWIAVQRPFNGIIEEFTIARGKKTEEDIGSQWKKIKAKYP